jgi:Flp pilus assembly protein TadG
MSGRLAVFARCRRGSAALETAFALPFILTLGFAAADAGWLLAETHRMKSGLAAGAHLLARSQDFAAAEDEARNLAVTGNLDGTGGARVKGWTPADVTVTYRMVANAGGAYSGGSQVRVVRLESAVVYSGFGLLKMAGVEAVTIRGAQEERWTGG